MITENQTNTVYFATLLKTDARFASFCNDLTNILEKHKINHGFLENAKDIWCRDYMPVQVSEDRFVEYVYDPDYLKTKHYSQFRTNPADALQNIPINTIKTDIVLDGGNVIKYGQRVILTDKVFAENKNYTQLELTNKLKDLFQITDLIIIPWDKELEPTYGHSDGIVRFIDEDRVLIDEWYASDYSGQTGIDLRKALSTHGLIIESLEFNVSKPHKWSWGYINFLQLKDLLLIPVFGIEEDNQAIAQFHKLFPTYSTNEQIETIDARAMIKHGGVLNCISWSVKKC